VKAGRGSPHDGVFLDIASQRNAADIRRKLPSMYHQFKELANVDITREAMEIGPTCHYMMGGIKVDAETQSSTVPGLFAAGECAGGLHGANRLGGNSLSDLLVFGRRAGLGAAEFAKRQKFAEAEVRQAEACEKELLKPLERERGENPFAVMESLQKVMETHCGIIREEKELCSGLEALEEIKIRAQNVKAVGDRCYNAGWHCALDLKNMLTVSEAIARAAIERKESRGAHTREDFPESSGEFGKLNIVIHKEGEKIKVAKRPLPEWPAEVGELIEK
ncbi:MAG: FAD-binding protein, partial [Deltaproteobacteria bacterium]|nr:FAD-binding protein [Deltaproteobacteria bacterium]